MFIVKQGKNVSYEDLTITNKSIEAAKDVLRNHGICSDEAWVILEAVCTMLGIELFPKSTTN